MQTNASTIFFSPPYTLINASHFPATIALWPRPSTGKWGVQINGGFVGQI